MQATATPSPHRPDKDRPDPSLRLFLMISGGLHLAVLILSIVTLPYIGKTFEPVDMITVELAPIADKTQAVKPPVEAPKPKEEKKEEPPKTTDKPKPAPTVVPKEEVAAPSPDELAPPKPEKPKEVEVKKPEEKPKEPPKVVDKKPKLDEPKKTQEQDFNSLLKNLAENKPAEEAEEKNKAEGAATPQPQAPLGAQMTMSEMDALRQQLTQCWNIMAGANAAENLAVDVEMVVNPDRTVREARILDQARYNQDPFFRAAADSALRAVKNPLCTPLRLPPDKYDMWKNISVRFDPKEMLR